MTTSVNFVGRLQGGRFNIKDPRATRETLNIISAIRIHTWYPSGDFSHHPSANLNKNLWKPPWKDHILISCLQKIKKIKNNCLRPSGWNSTSFTHRFIRCCQSNKTKKNNSHVDIMRWYRWCRLVMISVKLKTYFRIL